ncbi:hypothetical protein EIK77_001799 [Talaromyces pinophilus]|nr:hypothetical protein EIK77_001799 [Talaromyces pinophilus]
MISDKLYQFAVSDKSVSSELAENPNQSPGEIVNRLFKHKQEATGDNPEPPTRADGEEANLQRALECGNWGGQRPMLPQCFALTSKPAFSWTGIAQSDGHSWCFGLLQSNNIQDNDNLEMMVHLEGPIVDAMYDTLLISWYKHLDPALPMLGRPAAKEPIPAHDNLASKAELTNATASGSQQKQVEILPESTSSEPHYDQTFVEEAKRVNSQLDTRSNESRRDAATRHLSKFVYRIDLVEKLT